ncbi:hypothetical protein PENNAL_c0294G05033, partial [Penicillium nalgiovense]
MKDHLEPERSLGRNLLSWRRTCTPGAYAQRSWAPIKAASSPDPTFFFTHRGHGVPSGLPVRGFRDNGCFWPEPSN